VNGFSKLSFEAIMSIEITLFECNCLTILYLRRICLNLSLCTKFCALNIAAWLSQWIYMTDTNLGHNDISSRNCWSHSASSPALSKPINSDFIVEWSIQVCLEDFQDSTTPPRVKMYPLVDFDFSESAIYFASLYLSSTSGCFLYLKVYFSILQVSHFS